MAEDNTDFFEDSHKLLTKYIDDRLLLLKIQTAEKSGKILAKIITIIVLTILASFVMFFLSMMGGYYFADVTGSMFKGFGIVALIYIAFFFAFLVYSKYFLHDNILNMVIKILFEKSEQELELEDDEQQ